MDLFQLIEIYFRTQPVDFVQQPLLAATVVSGH